MRLFLDTEFNGMNGELISMALVGDDGREWYEVRKTVTTPCVWVAEHVIPKLGKPAISVYGFQTSLIAFLVEIAALDDVEIVADWPADFEHLCNVLTAISANSGFSIPFECSLKLVRGDDTIVPENPHNALSDARALRDWYLRQAPKE